MPKRKTRVNLARVGRAELRSALTRYSSENRGDERAFRPRYRRPLSPIDSTQSEAGAAPGNHSACWSPCRPMEVTRWPRRKAK
jgi:hypothetical protein